MFFYNIGIFIYGFAIRVASSFSTKARLWREGRKNIFRELALSMEGKERVIWIHCASLGEFEQGRPVIEKIRSEKPGYKILLTFFSPSGYQMRKDYPGADNVFYLPLDTPSNARRFMDIVRPEIALFVKYEFWLNYLRTLKKNGVRTYIISAIFRKDSIFFKPYGGIFRKGLGCFDRLFVQDQVSAELLEQLGINNVTVAGDTRFDRVSAIFEAAKELPVIETFAKDSKVFIGGSTWPEDEELVLRLMDSFPGVKFIIAPHEVGTDRISSLAEKTGGAELYTRCISENKAPSGRLLIIDTIGILSSVYRYGDYAYIGGGFGAGIHNTLEAAAYGLPMAFGPNYQKFREARELIKLGAARSINAYGGLEQWLDEMYSDATKYATAKAKALSYISHNTGATAKILSSIFPENK